MKSEFPFSIDSLKRISGQSSYDLDVAQEAANKLVAYVSAQAAIIDDYVDLKRILTLASQAEITNALIGMRQVSKALSELTNFHRRGLLIDAFDPAQHKVKLILEESEEKARSLLVFIKG